MPIPVRNRGKEEGQESSILDEDISKSQAELQKIFDEAFKDYKKS